MKVRARHFPVCTSTPFIGNFLSGACSALPEVFALKRGFGFIIAA